MLPAENDSMSRSRRFAKSIKQDYIPGYLADSPGGAMSGLSPCRAILKLALILNLAAGPIILSAQQAPAGVPGVTIRANTRLVVVDVVVTDKKGQPVAGLKADDFAVEENGKKQKVSVFVAPGAATGPKPEPARPGILSNHPEHVGPSGVPTVLILDALNSPFKEQAYARSQMLKYVVEQSQAGQFMAVVALTDRLHVLQQFTSDPQVLLTAIKNFKPQEQILKGTPPPPASDVALSGLGMNYYIYGGVTNAEAAIYVQGQLASFNNLQIGYDLERRTRITIEAMRTLTRMLGGLQGRKTVVWLTADLPFDLIPEDRNVSDAELTSALPAMGNQAVSVRGAGAVAAEERQLHGQEIKDAESRLANAGIAIYPVDLRGLVGGMESLAAVNERRDTDANGAGLAKTAITQAQSLEASQGTMREVAAETGGKAYMNENEIRQGVALAVSDNNASYEIGYYPENRKWDGKYRKIAIRVAQDGTQTRHRKGYFALDPMQIKEVNGEQDVAAALAVGAPATQVSFMAQLKPTDPGKVRVVFLVDAHTLSAEDSGANKKMNVTLYAGLYDASGKSLAVHSTKVDRAFDAATYQQILDHGMMVPIDMDVAAGAKELRLAVLDGKTGFIGTASGPLGQ
jgi:VWFA-related protein